jgi:hypothetical protein
VLGKTEENSKKLSENSTSYEKCAGVLLFILFRIMETV